MNNTIFCPLKDFGWCKCETNNDTCHGERMIVEKDDFIYVVIGKSASTSIIKTLDEKKGIYKPTEYLFNSDKFKFSFIRNPFSRLVSGWNGWIKRNRPWLERNKYFNYNMSFPNFIETLCSLDNKDINYHFVPQTEFLYDENNEPICDFHGKVEDINNHWDILKNELSKHFNYKLNDIQHKAKTGIGDSYKKYYTPELKEMVFKKFKDDFNNFNYDF